MKFRLSVILCVLLLLLIPLNKANSQSFTQYAIKINADDSASWTITQVADISAPVDTWEGFQNKTITLVDSAANLTQRQMDIDTNSLQMETTISQSKTTVYTFKWLNFSVMKNGKILFGDVFRLAGFFNKLYGEGELEITYPSAYAVESVSPTPNQQNSTFQMLKWFRTQDFVNGNPIVTLTGISQNQTTYDWQLPVIALSLAAITAAALTGFYLFKRRSRKERRHDGNTFLGSGGLEGDEEEIVKVIRLSGGSQRQSIIAEQCRFSKAKTSQLLAGLERKGVVRRYKKGRDKIVTLASQNK